MMFRQSFSPIFVSVFLLFAGLCPAEGESPFRTKVTGLKGIRKLAESTSVLSVDGSSLAEPVGIQARIPGYGRLSALFTKGSAQSWISSLSTNQGIKDDSVSVVLLRGYISTRTGKKIVSGSLISDPSQNRKILKIILHGNTKQAKNKRSYDLSVVLPDSSDSAIGKIHSIAPSFLKLQSCGLEASSERAHGEKAEKSSIGVKAGALRVVRIATDADSALYQQSGWGNLTNANIATILNDVSSLYEAQLGIRLQLTQQHVFSSSSGDPYTSTDAGTLLDQFGNYTSTNRQIDQANLYHLFTGKNLDGSTIGIAWMGVVCRFPSNVFGLTQNLGISTDSSIVAHEMGHNFGANHDNSDLTSIMAPVLNSPPSRRFSTASIATLNQYVSSYGSCMSQDSSPGPIPTTAPTATPTSVPSLPTATPNPSPTDDPNDGDDDGDGGGGGINPDPSPSLFLSSRKDRKGGIIFQVDTSDLDESCDIRLLGWPSLTPQAISRGVTLFRPEKNAEVTISGRVTRSLQGSVSLQVVAQCDDEDTYRSNTVRLSLQIKRAASQRPAQWLRLLLKSLLVN